MSQENKAFLYDEKPVKPTGKTVETIHTSEALATVHEFQKELMTKMNKGNVSKGEWKKLASHAKKAKETAPNHEHKELDGIALTAEAMMKG